MNVGLSFGAGGAEALSFNVEPGHELYFNPVETLP